MPRVKNPIPIFSNYLDKIEDPFWYQIFDDASRGELPNGFSHNSYNAGILYFKNHGTISCLKLNPDPNYYPTVIDFFRKKGGITSELDRINTDLNKQAPLQQEWKKMTGRYKEAAVEMFVTEQAITNGLNHPQRAQLRDIIKIGWYLNCAKIIVRDNKIVNIENLYYDLNKQEYRLKKLKPAPVRKTAARKNTRKREGMAQLLVRSIPPLRGVRTVHHRTVTRVKDQHTDFSSVLSSYSEISSEDGSTF